MNSLIRWLEGVHDHVSDDFDSMVPVIGDEGMGKSTLMLELGWLWRDVIGREQTVESVMDQIAWDYNEFKTMLAERPPKSCIIVHDAARVLSRKKAMRGEQIELEEDLLDARFGNYLVLLGFQGFDIVPTMLATRRSKNALRVVKRGWVHGHNEAAIRSRYNNDEWPEPVLRDSFPSLDGKDLWKAFVEEDQRRKRERIKPDEEEDEMDLKELAEEIGENNLEAVISEHGAHGTLYIDADLVRAEYDLSQKNAKMVTKLLKRDYSVPQEDQEEKEHTPSAAPAN